MEPATDVPPQKPTLASRLSLGSGGGASLSFGELRGLVGRDDFDFIGSLQVA